MPYRDVLAVNSVYHVFTKSIAGYKIFSSEADYKRIVGNKGVHIMREDWDNLIILDACRYDMFEKVNSIKGIINNNLY